MEKIKPTSKEEIEQTDSPFPEYETETEIIVNEVSEVYKVIDDKPNCQVDIIFKNGKELKFEHWAPPPLFLELWGKPNKGFITLDFDEESYITIDKREVISKVVQPI